MLRNVSCLVARFYLEVAFGEINFEVPEKNVPKLVALKTPWFYKKKHHHLNFSPTVESSFTA